MKEFLLALFGVGTLVTYVFLTGYVLTFKKQVEVPAPWVKWDKLHRKPEILYFPIPTASGYMVKVFELHNVKWVQDEIVSNE